MNYLDIDFPMELLTNFSSGIEFSTSTAMLKNKQEIRHQNWQEPRYKYNLIYKNCNEKTYQKLQSFFLLCNGRQKSFNFFDINDNKITNQPIAIGDGTNNIFEIYKLYSYQDMSYKRAIYKIFDEKIYINNEIVEKNKYNLNNGSIYFKSAPKQNDIISIECNFYVIVRFENDYLPIIRKNNIIELPDICLIETKNI